MNKYDYTARGIVLCFARQGKHIISIFRRKYGEKQTRKGVVYFQTAPKIAR
jgi:hypothetical protein